MNHLRFSSKIVDQKLSIQMRHRYKKLLVLESKEHKCLLDTICLTCDSSCWDVVSSPLLIAEQNPYGTITKEGLCKPKAVMIRVVGLEESHSSCCFLSFLPLASWQSD